MLAILNVNSWEYLIIGVVALMVIGPEQLPTVMRKGGQYLRQFRDTSDKLKDEFMKGVDELDPNRWVDNTVDPTEPRKLGKAVSPGGPRQVRPVDPGANGESESNELDTRPAATQARSEDQSAESPDESSNRPEPATTEEPVTDTNDEPEPPSSLEPAEPDTTRSPDSIEGPDPGLADEASEPGADQ